jgi:uncharacterized protein (DUF1778 family)
MRSARLTAKPILFRCRPKERELVERACEVADVSMSGLARRAVLARARRILSEAKQDTAHANG